VACSDGNCGGFCYSILTAQQDINSVLMKTKRAINQSANINKLICDQWRYILVIARDHIQVFFLF
jgi:hypothetical protein